MTQNQSESSFRYGCRTCLAKFTVRRSGGAVRCSSCGSLQTGKISELPPPKRVRPRPVRRRPSKAQAATNNRPEHLLSAFACVNCAQTFQWNHTLRRNMTVTCPKCRSVDVVERSPRARVLVVSKASGGVAALKKAQRVSLREAKRIRFITRNWRLRCELKEWLEGLETLLSRMQIDGPKIQNAKRYIGELLAEADARQVDLLEQHDMSVAQERVGA